MAGVYKGRHYRFIGSIDSPSIYVVWTSAASYDEDSRQSFVKSFFSELSKVIYKSSLPKSSPRKLSKFGLFGDETPTKETLDPSESLPSAGLLSFPTAPSNTKALSLSLPVTLSESIRFWCPRFKRQAAGESMPQDLVVEHLGPSVTEWDIFDLFGRENGVVFAQVTNNGSAGTNYSLIFRQRIEAEHQKEG
jgi:hypothetical protein